MSIAGYPERGNPILGEIKSVLAGEGGDPADAAGFTLDAAGKRMPTIGYANAPAATPGLSRLLPPGDKNYLAAGLATRKSETHGGEDVALFADGPRADLVAGVIEQNLIFHIIAEALGWR